MKYDGDCPRCGRELEEWYFENSPEDTWLECSNGDCDFEDIDKEGSHD